MPFKSEAQRRFMFSQHPSIAKRWASEYPDQGKLPEHSAVAKKAAIKRLRKRGLANEAKAKAGSKATFESKSGPVAKHRGARGAL